ncbi:hydroxysqualene dehydroxylase HpnE [Undibacterium rugosum]|uniref:hydroxysqualene dehydroxylase HpnE n=1 Tax=Undibacterium rugosum TaxID=2762291 RepID=UPI002E3562A8|nr:hydroxysqualene dehydroxylase HpnE [Undibacterium rugosum]
MADSTLQIAVIGAGWAGCSAAVKLTQAGHTVCLLEASAHAGGRARRVDLQDYALDNGQHILLGAYRDSLALMRELGLHPEQLFKRLPLQMIYPPATDGMHFLASGWPAPLHLLMALWRARGLSREDKQALARFSTTARWMNWQLHQDCSAEELLVRFEQTPRLTELMWNPLCVAALNTPPALASAQVFLNVLRDSLGASRSASDMLLPVRDLGSLLPQAAIDYLDSRAAEIRLSCPVRQIQKSDNGKWTLHTGAGSVCLADQVVIATDSKNAARLLNPLTGPEFRSIPDYDYAAITTIYLQYGPEIRLERAMFALRELPERAHWGQFVFDRGQLHAEQAGLLAVVISAPTKTLELTHEELATQVALQLAESLQNPALQQPVWFQIITEKRATYLCRPNLNRPDNRSTVPGIYLAGDYTAGDYPATLEAAVRSGIAAAHLLIADAKKRIRN